MQDFEKTLKELGQLQKSLRSRVLVASFIFPLLAILAQYDKFAFPFQALTELMGSLLGAAGVLLAYFGNQKNPVERVEDLMDFEPRLSGFIAALSLVTSAVCFYGYYYFASQANELSLLFLCLGVFVFFWSLTNTLFGMNKATLQKRVWNKLDDEARAQWIERQKTLEKVISDLERIREDIDKTAKGQRKILRKKKWAARRDRFLYKVQDFQERTFPIRKKIGLVTLGEKARADEIAEKAKQWVYEYGPGWHNYSLSEIAQGKSNKLFLECIEGIDLAVHEVGTWKYLILVGRWDLETAQRILACIRPFEKDENGKFYHVGVITDPSTEMSVEAKSVLTDAGIELIESETTLVPQSQDALQDHPKVKV